MRRFGSPGDPKASQEGAEEEGAEELEGEEEYVYVTDYGEEEWQEEAEGEEEQGLEEMGNEEEYSQEQRSREVFKIQPMPANSEDRRGSDEQNHTMRSKLLICRIALNQVTMNIEIRKCY